MSAIRLGTAACVRAFQALSSALDTSKSTLKHLIEPEGLSDEFGRLRVWSGNLGALQKGHSSLDYRLRDSPLLSSNVLKLLAELDSNLAEAHAVVLGSRLPYEQQPQPDSGGESDTDSFFSEDEDSNSEDATPKTELEQRFCEIVDIIDNLYKLSVRIRSPTLHSRSLKAASFQAVDSETGVDMFEQYRHFDLLYTRELLKYLRTPHVGSEEGEDDYLIERLSKAITLRRRQFKYWRRHRDKLGVIIAQDGLNTEQLHTLPHPELPRHVSPEAETGSARFTLSKVPASEKPPRSLLSGTEATHYHQSLDEIVDSQSVTSYASTTRDLTGRGIELPSPPRAADGEKDFECPYCYVICPARYGKGRSWRTHLLQDLQPYVCTYEKCRQPDQLFRSRREWADHEATHRKLWRCPEHLNAVFLSQTGLEDHLRWAHSNTVAEYQFASIVRIGETSAIDTREKCPICFASADMEGGLQNHIAHHLERLAAFALPKDLDTVEDDPDGASSVASRGRSFTTRSSQDPSTISLQRESRNINDGIADLVAIESEASTLPGEASETPSDLLEVTPVEHSIPLSTELLRSVPDESKQRLEILLIPQQVTQMPSQRDAGGPFSYESDSSEDLQVDIDLEGTVPGAELLKRHLMTLHGAQYVRFFRRSTFWRGYAKFKDVESAKNALMDITSEKVPVARKIQLAAKNNTCIKFVFPFTGAQSDNIIPSSITKNNSSQESETSSSSASSEAGEEPRDQQLPLLTLDDIPSVHSLYRTGKLQQRDQSYVSNDIYNRTVSLVFYDITRLQVDAIINSANSSLKVTRMSDSLCRYIHEAAGPNLKRECRSINATTGLAKTGEARITAGYGLPCKKVIHAIRPRYSESTSTAKFQLLTKCYQESLIVAMENEIKTIAFPTLAAGGCGFPPQMAARIALQGVREFLDIHNGYTFEKIIFCVYSEPDERAYKDFLPVFFPPTQGDVQFNLQNAPQILSGMEINKSSLRQQLSSLSSRVQKVTGDLELFCQGFSKFPQEAIDEFWRIAPKLCVFTGLLGPENPQQLSSRTTADINLALYVMESICASVSDTIEQTMHTESHEPSTREKIWQDFDFYIQYKYGHNLQSNVELCRLFTEGLIEILGSNSNESLEMKAMRERLTKYRLNQMRSAAQKDERHETFEEVLYARAYQSQEISKSHRNTISVSQIPSLSRLYRLGELEYRPTNTIPNNTVNHTVCLIRHDITKLEVDVIVNSTDMRFSGMGALDSAIFKGGGLSMQEDCANFGTNKERDIKLTAGYHLPCRHVIHTIPPAVYREDTKDALRKCYRDALHIAVESLHARTIALPAIGTGMLNYPRQDAAEVAIVEVKRFLETYDRRGPTPLEKIIFCVFTENVEFIYKSLLPIYFPPTDLNTRWTSQTKSGITSEPTIEETPSSDETKPPPRSLFSSIGEAFRNVRLGKQPITQSARPLNSSEKHTLLNFESHASNCSVCINPAQVYANNEELCPEGYEQAQDILRFLYMKTDGHIWSSNLEDGSRPVKVEMPSLEYPISRNMLFFTEKSYRDPHRTRPFVTPNQSWTERLRDQQSGRTAPLESSDTMKEVIELPLPDGKMQEAEVTASDPPSQPPETAFDSDGPTTLPTLLPILSEQEETAVAELFVWSSNRWEALHRDECIVNITTGYLEAHAITADNGPTLVTVELAPYVPIKRVTSRDIVVGNSRVGSQSQTAHRLAESHYGGKAIMFRSRTPEDSAALLEILMEASRRDSGLVAGRKARRISFSPQLRGVEETKKEGDGDDNNSMAQAPNDVVETSALRTDD
ncbi:hypothetical protein GQ43DRAFT_459672 [Delitschia confertaspora ATCC 74209]|uniref:Macro domain-containing protein n=1 Tax=Delitschia confertaspora ATCC 74209 TaxID=1513339 RepID=A0A9P4JUK0_9PLEO|nr:hypothetical protein GQ43DRAFT_459672 [Delitschia confertaspora ATCC 74209]